ncbi:hypothetical protein [Microvirga tunisiensis]|uniref:Lipoprotein n=1 Tax=Microvirga tunisiensis TaxID=2108360 RepID=A0A5N7MA99_9HYPH|nr:hypothetical protein [Microvirga tunisiensis]MPR05633.1 hypothetical protein [Microvirga tunisiensis]MPR23833.1 hypothetical protein [Microvirga tunisiensis]
MIKPVTLALLGLGLAGCANVSDAPVAGKETFVPLTNQAYYIEQKPFDDDAWMYPPEEQRLRKSTRTSRVIVKP